MSKYKFTFIVIVLQMSAILNYYPHFEDICCPFQPLHLNKHLLEIQEAYLRWRDFTHC